MKARQKGWSWWFWREWRGAKRCAVTRDGGRGDRQTPWPRGTSTDSTPLTWETAATTCRHIPHTASPRVKEGGPDGVPCAPADSTSQRATNHRLHYTTPPGNANIQQVKRTQKKYSSEQNTDFRQSTLTNLPGCVSDPRPPRATSPPTPAAAERLTATCCRMP